MCRKLCYFFKIFKGQSYIFRTLPSVSKAYNTRTNNNVAYFNDKHIFFRNLFFPLTELEPKKRVFGSCGWTKHIDF